MARNNLSPGERTPAAIRRHLSALPAEAYELRMIDNLSRQCVASRWWTREQIEQPDHVAFLRARNCEGCDVYFRPYAGTSNAGYVLLDFDTTVCPLARMRTDGRTPAVVLQTSPGHQQAWVRIAAGTMLPTLATAGARRLAQAYGADPASAEWRHLGRLAGFTNRKPQHRSPCGLPPFVQVLWTGGPGWISVEPVEEPGTLVSPLAVLQQDGPKLAAGEYARWLSLAGVWMPVTDGSVADYRVARALLSAGFTPAAAIEVLRAGSPGFPRRHSDPDGYLRRTVARAAAELDRAIAFSRATAK